MRVGLVLGAGGVLGGAWTTGGLYALATETGWDPGSAEYLVGTSAGAMNAALLAAGVPPWFMVAHSSGETAELVRDGEPRNGDESRSAGAVFRLHPGLPSLGPGSWRLALTSLARPYRYSPAALLAGWLPRGLISTEPLKQTIRRVAGEEWPPHPNLWLMACEHHTARRVAFGREDAPAATLPDAVAASCAIPGFYRPVEIDGHSYVDGGVASTSNLDVLIDEQLDLVICMNPTSSLHEYQSRTLAERAAGALRQASGKRLGAEAKRLRAAGTEVILIQPTVHDLDVMGTNLMSTSRRHEVIEVAARTVAAHLRGRELRALLRELPGGDRRLVRRPRGALTELPDFAALAAERWPAASGRR